MKKKDSPALRGHMAALRAAALGQWAATMAAAFAFIKEGLAAALALGLLAFVFYLARPGPCQDLDRETGRD